MNFIAAGTNHKYSPLALREKFSLSEKRRKEALLFLREMRAIKEAVIISTCNRFEIYGAVDKEAAEASIIEDFISRYYEMRQDVFSPYLYKYSNTEAVKHLFRVTAGLDSLILGERQIFGQVRRAFQQAQEAAFSGEFLRRIFTGAFYAASKIHSQTKLSWGRISVGSVSVEFIKKRLGSLYGKNIVIIGVGKVSELVLKYLTKEKPCVVFIANRTYGRAKELADKIGATAVRFDCLKAVLSKADVIITATSSPHFIIKKENLEEARGFLPSSCRRNIIIVDLALPRDVDPALGERKDVELACLDDLSSLIEKNREKKKQEAEKAEAIIKEQAEKICPEFLEAVAGPAL